MQSLTVNLGERSYPIVAGADQTDNLRSELERLSQAGRGVAVLTDSTVARVHGKTLAKVFGSLPVLAVEAGEGSKSLTGLGRVLDFLAEARIDRHGALFAFGGGVVGDLAGFAAACWLRGIDYYQVPTTLLAMVDSSVGGKTGINLSAGKNLAGAFHQPRGVYISTDLLATLPPREFAAGMAEVIKYGLLGDAGLFGRLEESALTVRSDAMPAVICRCCALKAQIVAADERETAKEGGRALLNLGHTFAHAIENAAGYGEYLHGEAVAIGLCAAARLSQKCGRIGGSEVARIEKVVAAHDLPARLRSPLKIAALLDAMRRDKKVRSGELRFVVLKKIGEAATQVAAAGPIDEVLREMGAA